MTAAPEVLPWSGHHCFGCSPANGSGLRLEFTRTADGLSTTFRLDRHYESYPGVVHGGIIAVICDETIGNLVVLRHSEPAVTTTMRMRYVGVVSVGREYRCVARATDPHDGLISGSAEVLDEHDAVAATATAIYRPHPGGD